MPDIVSNINYSVATGGNSTIPFIIHFDTRAPTEYDVNYPIQKQWVDSTDDNLYILQNFTTTNGVIYANWIDITSGLSSTETLSGNSGTTGPDSMLNINVVGDGTYITTVANPATHTLTISPTSAITTLYAADSGTATPSSGTITFAGGTNVTTSAAGSTITINSTAPALTWADEAAPFNAATAHGYFIIGNITATLAASPSNGDTISFIIQGTHTLTIQANTGQTLQLGDVVGAAAGTLVSAVTGNAVTIIYRSTNTNWVVLNSVGNWTVS